VSRGCSECIALEQLIFALLQYVCNPIIFFGCHYFVYMYVKIHQLLAIVASLVQRSKYSSAARVRVVLDVQLSRPGTGGARRTAQPPGYGWCSS
jgi:hypothetical protein